MNISLTDVKTIDVHCHPYLENPSPFSEIEFLEHLSLSVLPNMFQEKEQSEKIYPGMNMYMQITIQKLAKYFSCEPTVEAVVKKRNELAKKFPEYTKNLFEDV